MFKNSFVVHKLLMNYLLKSSDSWISPIANNKFLQIIYRTDVVWYNTTSTFWPCPRGIFSLKMGGAPLGHCCATFSVDAGAWCLINFQQGIAWEGSLHRGLCIFHYYINISNQQIIFYWWKQCFNNIIIIDRCQTLTICLFNNSQ